MLQGYQASRQVLRAEPYRCGLMFAAFNNFKLGVVGRLSMFLAIYEGGRDTYLLRRLCI